MSDAAFSDLPNKLVPRTVRVKDPALESPEATKWVFIGYCEKLLYKNERLQQLWQRFADQPGDPEWRNCLTRGQRSLYALGTFDGQVKNGGITQFFWNYPELILEVADALQALGEAELAEAYNQALERLVAKKDDWDELQSRSGRGASDFLKSFQSSYDVLDLAWFDDAYFKTHGPRLLARLVEYVKTHRGEFIES
jgi:hypothetical protein